MNVIIDLVLDYLVDVDDVAPFLSVSRAARHCAKRRICGIILEKSRSSPNSSDTPGRLSITMKWLHSYNGTSNSSFPLTAWVEPTEVVLSEDGWMLRFAKFSQMKSIFVVPAGNGVFDLSIRSLRPCLRHNVWFRDLSEIVDIIYGFILEGLWWVENNVCGSFVRNFGSTLSIGYEVYEGLPSEASFQLRRKHLIVSSKDKDEVDDGEALVPDRLEVGSPRCQRDESIQYFYRLSHLDISVSLFLNTWRDWKAPLKLCRRYPHRQPLDITKGQGIEVRNENNESQD